MRKHEHKDGMNGREAGGIGVADETPAAACAELPDNEPPAETARALAPLLLTEAQAAELLSLSPRKVWELAACGAIPSIKIGTVKRYRRMDLEEWVRRGCPTEREK